MQTAPAPLTTCAACGTPMDRDGSCPRCRAADDSTEHVEAIEFVVRRLEDWHRDGRLTDRQWQKLSDAYARQRQAVAEAGQVGQAIGTTVNLPSRSKCWSCKEPIAGAVSHCEECGAPLSVPAVKSLRFYRFLSKELDSFEHSGTIGLRQAHELVGETQDRIAALKRKLENDRAPMLAPLSRDRAPIAARRPARDAEASDQGPHRSLLEVLLDPRSIQWLLASGGGLLVLGLVIWLSSLGLFDNPGVVAAGLGIANAAFLFGGWALTLRTRYQFAGRALTLLACMVMPLNLWFYHAHGLLVLEGHLWVAALVCCAIYAGSAWVLKDALFVYVLVGGVTLTGMLLLGDLHKLDEIFAPVSMLIVLSLICLHTERAFPPMEDSPFSRQRFGMAFYWCAQALLASGLAILLVAQLIGWLPQPILRQFGLVEPLVATRTYLPWTLALVLAGTYALVYSDVVVRRIGVYIYLAALTLLWAEIQLLALLDFAGQQSIVIATLALTALVVNVVQVQFAEKRSFLRTVPPLGVLLSLIPVLFGVLLHFRATNVVLNELWPFQICNPTLALADRLVQAGPYLGAMAITALCCRAAAYLYRKSFPELSTFYFFTTAAATLVFAAGVAWTIGLVPWETQAPVLMLIPILYLIAAHLYRGHGPEQPLVWCAHASTVVMMVCSLYVVVGIVALPGAGLQVRDVVPVTGSNLNLLLAVFCLETAVFYGLAAALRKEGWNIYLATVMLCGALWQLLNFFGTPGELYPLAFSLVGLVLLIAYRFALLEKWEWAGLSRAGFQSANALTTLGFVAGILLSLSRLFMSEFSLAQLDNVAGGDWRGPVRLACYLMLFLTVVSLLAAWLVQQQEWRRGYLAVAIANGAMAALLYHKFHPHNPWQTLEIVSVLAGLGLLILGHVGWSRETDEHSSDMVSLALFFGSVSFLMPLAIATAVWRFAYTVSAINELALVFGCVALIGSGVVCRIRATTIFGSITLTAYVVMVLIYLRYLLEGMELIGIYLTVGGLLLFGTGLALSVYRDRLLALPERFKRREGVFRVFEWR